MEIAPEISLHAIAHSLCMGVLWLSNLAAVATLIIGVWSFWWPSTSGIVAAKTLLPNKWLIQYSYSVNGTEFHSDRMSPHLNSNWGIASGGPEASVSIWNSTFDQGRFFFEGKPVTVYYCKWVPSWACLRRGVFLTPTVFGFCSVFFYALSRLYR
jgi:hypothetical protein